MNRPTELCWVQVSELQRRLAKKAMDKPQHRFTKLYDLLTWEPLVVWAFDTLTASGDSRAAGSAATDRRTARTQRDAILRTLRAALKSGTYRPQPVRRACPANSNRKQRLPGDPTRVDRTVQLMVKAVLEPIFESDFHQESHAFRPGKSRHSAIAQLQLITAARPEKRCWAIRGKVSARFDPPQHQILMRLLRRRVQDKKLLRLIRQMLRAGVMEGQLFSTSTAGTPRGGSIAPLLANIYLHELDQWLHQRYTGSSYSKQDDRRKRKEGTARYVRHADDFVIVWAGTREGARQLQAQLAAFLREQLGLRLSAEDTGVAHIGRGYNFLGFSIKRYKRRKGGCGNLLIRPGPRAVMELKAKIKAMTKRATTGASVRGKIAALNQLLRAWANDYRYQASTRTFDYIGHYAFKRLELWLHKKTGQPVRAIYSRYYRRNHGYLTWVCDNQALFHPGHLVKIERLRYADRPNPYLGSSQDMQLTCCRTLPRAADRGKTTAVGRGLCGNQRAPARAEGANLSTSGGPRAARSVSGRAIQGCCEIYAGRPGDALRGLSLSGRCCTERDQSPTCQRNTVGLESRMR